MVGSTFSDFCGAVIQNHCTQSILHPQTPFNFSKLYPYCPAIPIGCSVLVQFGSWIQLLRNREFWEGDLAEKQHLLKALAWWQYLKTDATRYGEKVWSSYGMSNPPVPLTIRDQYPRSTPTEPIYRRHYLDDERWWSKNNLLFLIWCNMFSLLGTIAFTKDDEPPDDTKTSKIKKRPQLYHDR